MLEDTIVALATPPGESGIAVIRLSGKAALEIAKKLFLPIKDRKNLCPSHMMRLGWLMDGEERLDEILCVLMYGPHSYTGEDVAEFHLHGGMYGVRSCLRLCQQAGARMAMPGEFTQRAFLNDRLDLTQAEAVIDLIQAQSEKGLKLAVQQLKGQLKEQIAKLEDAFIVLDAQLIASMDFPDEVGDFARDEAKRVLRLIHQQLEQLLVSAERNEIYRTGVRLVICGKPNVGKSSLLNYLIRQDKAIVTDIPGTTRDVIEEFIQVKGVPLKVMDTAGLRSTEDVVEKIGVSRTRAAIETADLILFMLDVTTGITSEDEAAFAEIKDKKRIILVYNKIDAVNSFDYTAVSSQLGVNDWCKISLRNSLGIEDLEERIFSQACGSVTRSEELEVMTNLRQRDALKRCFAQVEQLLETVEIQTLDCLSIDVQNALEALGEITGKSLNEDILDRIFRDFCIGK